MDLELWKIILTMAGTAIGGLFMFYVKGVLSDKKIDKEKLEKYEQADKERMKKLSEENAANQIKEIEGNRKLTDVMVRMAKLEAIDQGRKETLEMVAEKVVNEISQSRVENRDYIEKFLRRE